MTQTDFVERNSIVRRIWGDPDLVLLIFAGSAAEFALNRSVDWLFFTGEIPRDPVGRLFSTVRYAQDIVLQMKRRHFVRLTGSTRSTVMSKTNGSKRYPIGRTVTCFTC